MKKNILLLSFFLANRIVFSQTFMHGAGLTLIVGSANTSSVSFGEGFTYSPRFNFIETDNLSVSVGIPLTVGLSTNTNYDYSYSYGSSIGIIANAPVLISLNMGRGSTKENTNKFGFTIGAGAGFHHGDFEVLETDINGYQNYAVRSINTFGPAANAGIRLGVGRKHRNVEVRFYYMKGINNYNPDIYGAGCLFNF